MLKNKNFVRAVLLALCVGLLPSGVLAQVPTGSIEGIVSDPQGGVLRGATVEATQKESGYDRTVTTGDDGAYRFSELRPGQYNVSVTAQGFKRAIADSVTVEVGQHTPLDIQLTAGGTNETIEVQGGEATVDRTDNTVDGVVNSVQIANLPLNGRNFLDLARLQPGADTVDGASFDPTKANYTGVTLGGQAGRSTQITVDGGSVVDNVVGTTVQNFSQEIVGEFQISLSNQDVSAGASSSGSVNVITKSGNNEFHGNGYIYYRDDQFSAFPGLERIVDPDKSDDFVPQQIRRVQFDREQFGGSLGGPIVKDRAFFFGNVEYNNQDSVSIFSNPQPLIQGFNGVGGQPFNELLVTGRVDVRLSDKHSLLGRYSHDDNDLLTPFPSGSGIAPRESASGIFSSNNQFVTNRADGFVIGLTSVLTTNLVNDVRYNFNDFTNDIEPDPTSNLNAPEIRVFDSGNLIFRSGPNAITPQITTQRRNQIKDDLSWVVGNHTLRFGGDFEHTAIGGRFAFSKPVARVTIWGPFYTGGVLASEADFLNAPVRRVDLGVGDDTLPFNSPDGATINNRFQPYVNDSWKIHPRFTLNLGLAYRYDSNLFNTDLSRPAVIAPLFGRGTAPPENDTNNWSPRVGFAWDIFGDAKTVIRGGAGIYYDTAIDNLRLFERADLGPPGAELFLIGPQVAGNLVPGGDLNFGATSASSSGFITLGDLLPKLGQIRSQLEATAFDTDAPTSIESGVGVSGPIFSSEFELPYSIQYSLGVQRELPWDMVVQADAEYQKTLHTVLTYDANRFFSADRNGNPLNQLPTDASNLVGPVPYADSGGFSIYKALLVRLDKRFTHNWQFTASYALSRVEGFGGDSIGLGDAVTNVFNLRDDYGPTANDRTHRFVFSTIYTVPDYDGDSLYKKALFGSWTFSLISTTNSGIPFSAFLPTDILGSNSQGFSYLPGTGPGSIGRDIKTVEELNSLITAYNNNLAGYAARIENGVPLTPFGRKLRAIALLPADTHIGGDSLISQDVRITKGIHLGENARLDLIAECFNLFNVSNVTGGGANNILANQSAVDKATAAGGTFDFTTFEPARRQTNIFGTGGPRAFQFAAKFVF